MLFAPSDLVNLYFVGRPKGAMTYEFPDQFVRDRGSLDRRSILFGSSVNIDDPDYKAHPLYKVVKPMRVVLTPGQCLYLPAFWGHEVQSVPDFDQDDPNSARLNIALNFWFANATLPIDDTKVLMGQ